jgi:hypothetical protein
VVYLLSQTNKRVYRYDLAAGRDLNPFVLRDGAKLMTLSEPHGRLYLSYEDGGISKIELLGDGAERDFAVVPQAAHGLLAAGKYLLAADPSGAWNAHYSFDVDGHLLSYLDWNYYSREYAWSDALQRAFYFEDDQSPTHLHFEHVDQSTGALSQGEGPYDSSYSIAPPIRVSPDGGYVLLGTGGLFDGTLLQYQLSLPIQPLDALWLDDGTLLAMTTAGDLHLYDSNFVETKTANAPTPPLRLLPYQHHVYAVSLTGGRPAFSLIAM